MRRAVRLGASKYPCRVVLGGVLLWRLGRRRWPWWSSVGHARSGRVLGIIAQ